MERRRFVGILGLGGLAGAVLMRRSAASDTPPATPSDTPPAAPPAAPPESATVLGGEPPAFTGPGPNLWWSSVGPYVAHPQKLPLIQLTDRPVQLETPRAYFAQAITPTAAFFVRWHLPNLPDVDLASYRLRVTGAVEHPLELSMAEVLALPAVEVTAVNQCSGNSRSRFQPRVAGGQWGNGACGCATWRGVSLRALLERAGVRPTAVQVQLHGMDTGNGPEGKGSHAYAKSLDLAGDALDHAVLAYAMNGEPLPALHGFPLRLVVPGYFSTYWVKAVGAIDVLEQPDDGFWMKTAYRLPDTPNGGTTPAEAATVATKPIGTMPVRSLLANPDGQTKLLAGCPVTLRGVAFSGRGAITRVQWSVDEGATWNTAALGADLGPFAFRTFEASWTPPHGGTFVIAIRAHDAAGAEQTDDPLWNGGGYGWNRIERQTVVVADAGGAA
jgi:DMSO/TMAO reductase YedYZ molybdopterin-dependent catalytic subunit